MISIPIWLFILLCIAAVPTAIVLVGAFVLFIIMLFSVISVWVADRFYEEGETTIEVIENKEEE